MRRLLIAVLLTSASPLYATTYYISPSGSNANDGLSSGAPKKTFANVFALMAAGDTLNLMDGTYSVAAGTGAIEPNGTGSGTPPSGISVAQPTIIQAINAGSVKVVGYAADEYSGTPLRLGGASVTKSYIVIDGITFDNDEAGWVGGMAGWLYKASYVTVKNCGFLGTFGIGTSDHAIANDYNLIQDVWVAANQVRIIAINYRANKNVWRRVLVRGDGCGTAGCTSEGNPNVGFSVYDSADISIQNMIQVDRILLASPNVDEPYGDFSTAQHGGASYPLGRDEWLGVLSLNSDDSAFHFEADEVIAGATTIKMRNVVSWNAAGIAGVNIGGAAVLSVDMSGLTISSTVGQGLRVYQDPNQPTGTVSNVEIADALDYGILVGAATLTYCNVFGATSAYHGSSVSCTGSATTANALADSPVSIKYPLRVEADGAALHGTGSGGADKGANIVKRYGVDGTRFGDAFYNTLTSTDLWPWPNQVRIKQEMCTDLGITRGFCAGGLTFTGYVWNYLGNGSPYEGGGSPVTVQAQALPDGLTSSAYSQCLSATGGNGSAFAWTISAGSLPPDLALGASTGCITGIPSAANTYNFTAQACDTAPTCDTEAFTINVSSPPAMTAAYNVGSNALVARSGLAGLSYSQSCTATLLLNAQSVATNTVATGFATRAFSFSSLTPSTQYCIDVACGAVGVTDRYCPTTLASSTGSQTIPFSFGAPFAGLAGAARLTVDCDDNAALSSPASVQDTSVGSGASVNQSWPAGLIWCRHRWQTAADAVLATSAIQPLVIP